MSDKSSQPDMDDWPLAKIKKYSQDKAARKAAALQELQEKVDGMHLTSEIQQEAMKDIATEAAHASTSQPTNTTSPHYYGRTGLVQPVSLRSFTGDEKSQISLFDYVEQMRSLQSMTNWTNVVILQRIPFTLEGTAKIWWRRYARKNSDLDTILQDLVKEFCPMADASLRKELRSRVQTSQETVAQFYYALLSIAERVDQVSPGSPVSESMLAQTMLDGLLPAVKSLTMQSLVTKLGRLASSATLEQVRESAEGAEAVVMAMTPQVSTGFPTRSVNVVSSGSDRIDKLAQQIEALTGAVNEVRSGSGYHPRKKYDSPRPAKPNSDCRHCREANVPGDIKHWSDQCPLVKFAVSQYRNQHQAVPPPPPHVPANDNANQSNQIGSTQH
jgi:hypothetical protein